MTDDDDRDQLLRAAREHAVDEYGATIRTDSRDRWGRHGWFCTVDGATMLLCAKAHPYGDMVSFSKPVLASALEAEAWLLLWDGDEETLSVFDAAWVRDEGVDDTVESKRADKIGITDVPEHGGVDLRAFTRGERPEGVDATAPTTLREVQG